MTHRRGHCEMQARSFVVCAVEDIEISAEEGPDASLVEDSS
jgi:hypothetical protein